MQPNEVGQNIHKKRRSRIYLAIFIVTAAAAGVVIWWVAGQIILQKVELAEPQPVDTSGSTEAPKLQTEVVLNGRANVWDIAFLPTREMLFTERGGTVSIFKDDKVSPITDIQDAYSRGEGGLMGMAIDPDFTENRYIYTCFNSSQGGPDVRVVRWRLNEALTGLEDRNDIITGIPSNQSGRHSGCRMAFGPDGYLWVGTGDAALGDSGLQPRSLGGKILRVDRDGKGVPGNVGGDYDSRVYSYAHRNTQGIAFFDKPRSGVLGVSVEHGSSVDDEVNLLKPGNFGWAPAPGGYNESGVPMTDKQRFPDAIEAIWKSGNPTQAPSGVAVIKGRQWQGWQGALAVAFLKDKHLKIMQLDNNLNVTKTQEILTDFGRLRAVTQGPDGALYISTSNGSNDRIIRLSVQ